MHDNCQQPTSSRPIPIVIQHPPQPHTPHGMGRLTFARSPEGHVTPIPKKLRRSATACSCSRAVRAVSAGLPDGFWSTGVMFPPATPTGITETPPPERPPLPVPHHGLEPNPGRNDPVNGKFPNKRGSKAIARCRIALFWVVVVAGVIDGVIERIVDGVVERIVDGVRKGCGRIERPWPWAAGAADANKRGTTRVSQRPGAVDPKLKRDMENLLGHERPDRA